MRSTLFIVFCLTLLTACGGAPSEGADAQAAAAESVAKRLSEVDIATAQVSPLNAGLAFTGNLQPYDQAVVNSEVGGTLQAVTVREGEWVKKGQLLAQINNISLNQILQEQKAQVANSQANLNLAKIKLQQQQVLFEKGFISKLALDEAKNQFSVSQGSHRAQLAQMAQAEKSVHDLAVYAPMSGIVYERASSAGEVITANSKLFAIANLDTLEITATLSNQQVPLVRVGQTVSFQVDGDEAAYSGVIKRINAVADLNTRDFKAFIEVNNANGALKAGQFAQGSIITEGTEAFPLVPSSALQTNAKGQTFVWAVIDHQVQERPVTVMLEDRYSRRVAVTGIEPNTVVLRQTILGLKAGDSVSLPTAKP
ncbi:MAG: efflux RND transporter periplasmic adaptor subunit [Neisseriaceae bacterium]|nr:efflux RND transporter periplasmic adaptor subunit [Neisseriaceae bacterium]MBP6861959.1 efflux RND transporter periplasmic adaptor subunit [Neisseriaceae bacterium]